MINFIGIILSTCAVFFLCCFMYILGVSSVSKDLRQAVDNNKTIREFYYDKYPSNYKQYYTDWKKYDFQ